MTFRFSNLASPDVRHSNEVAMLQAAVWLLTSRPQAGGLLKANGEYILLMRLPGEKLSFGHDWRDYFADNNSAALNNTAAGHPVRKLPQPFM